MTINEFQTRYHDYKTTDQMKAMLDSLKLRVVDENGKECKVIPVRLGNEWCLMIDMAAATIRELCLDTSNKDDRK